MIYHFGSDYLNAQRGELRCASQPVVLEPKVFDVLLYLLQHRDRMVTKDELLAHCWAETFVSEAALTRCLGKVRKAIEPALAHVAADAPDLILLDVMMPVMDGFTVCRLLKAQDETRLIPIVIMTALDAVADRITGIKVGADDFLTKPVREEELVARIATALQLKHTTDHRLGE